MPNPSTFCESCGICCMHMRTPPFVPGENLPEHLHREIDEWLSSPRWSEWIVYVESDWGEWEITVARPGLFGGIILRAMIYRVGQEYTVFEFPIIGSSQTEWKELATIAIAKFIEQSGDDEQEAR